MEFAFYIFELLLYSTSLFFLVKKVYDVYINGKKYFLSIFVMTILLIISSFILSYDFLMCVFMLAQLLQIVFLKMFSSKIGFLRIFSTYTFIYSLNLVLSISLYHLFTINDYVFVLIDLFTNIIVFSVSLWACFNVTFLLKLKYLLNVVPRYTKVLIISSCLFNGIFLVLLSSNPNIYENSPWNIVIRCLSVILSIIFLTILPICIVTSINNSYLKSQNEKFQKDIEAQAKHYSDLAKANYELRRFKHDFNNIKIGLEKTLGDNDYEAALSILENSNYDFQNIAEKMLEFDTGNGIVDALLSDKQSKANKSNTRIVFSGSVPPDSIAPTDLCVLFGNTLDNAIEACEKFEDETEKTILVSCKCNSGFAFISITNPVADDVVIRGNSIDSTKADKASHGYGLYSLNKIVKKLDGSLNLSCEDRIFKLEIDLSLEQTPIYA